MNLARYAKSIVAVAGVVATVAAVIAQSDLTNTNGIIACVVAVCVALGVYSVPNKPQA